MEKPFLAQAPQPAARPRTPQPKQASGLARLALPLVRAAQQVGRPNSISPRRDEKAMLPPTVAANPGPLVIPSISSSPLLFTPTSIAPRRGKHPRRLRHPHRSPARPQPRQAE
jgi:hypothetical protein